MDILDSGGGGGGGATTTGTAVGEGAIVLAPPSMFINLRLENLPLPSAHASPTTKTKPTTANPTWAQGICAHGMLTLTRLSPDAMRSASASSSAELYRSSGLLCSAVASNGTISAGI